LISASENGSDLYLGNGKEKLVTGNYDDISSSTSLRAVGHVSINFSVT